MNFLEFYRKYLAYEYWSPDLQIMAYRSMDGAILGNLILLFIVISGIFTGLPLIAWVVGKKLKDKGILSKGRYRFLVRLIIASVIIGLLCAINTTNNIWVAIAN
jgi:hypothetical protein